MTARTKSGVRVTQKKALGHPPILRGVNLIASYMMKTGLHVYKRKNQDGRERDKTHPAYPLLRRKVNAYVGAGTFKRTLTYHAIFYGNGYAFIFRDGRGRPQELLILSPCETYPVQFGGKLWYVTTIGNEQRKVPAEDVLHLKGLSFDGLVGHSIIEVMAEAFGLGISARDFAARFFGQGANASGILMIPGSLKRDAQKQVIKDFEQIASGIKNQHRVGLLHEGAKWQPMTINPEQSQMLATQQFDLISVANVLGIPAYKLGHPSRTSYSSIEWEAQAFIDDGLDPWFFSWEEECNLKLLSEAEQVNETHYFEFNRDELLKSDKITRVRTAAVEKQWGLSNTNEYRRRENLDTIGPAGDVYWAPSNMVPIDQLGQDKAAAAQAPAPDKEQEPEDPTLTEDKTQIRQATLAAVVDRLAHLMTVESEQLQRAAKREKDLSSWIEKFYRERIELYEEVLTPLVRIWAAASSQPDRMVSLAAGELADKVIRRAKAQALEDQSALISESELEELVSQVLCE
jgi:HK97 family phage portal protein